MFVVADGFVVAIVMLSRGMGGGWKLDGVRDDSWNSCM